MGPSGRFTHVGIILHFWDRYMQVLYLGRALRYKGDSAQFSDVALGNLTFTCIPRVDG